ncbi:hypothetical protein PFICI_13810 [Pestalotiopsis fici W106-1]|uniref:Haloacid dehalogenase n=1 Tax=Pestalotiopsis fici (strain W106-1 / CGMCC3.15140) TaxID=1229662 RepID=W3WJJ6_PESFW|nr:uncharacterized protein PFICI_13810 [Pestalotiopsis fici W106-1]ETS73944.1 hypothetical protein PFICI_13810 [Pestalotiopsis fici W106-1]
MAKPNLLLCFDAFGTLFRPKRPVVQQYGEIARQCGIGGFNDAQLQSSFRAAFKDEMKQNPNYGRSSGLGATKWWTNVIGKTFRPLVSNDQPLPSELVPRLLHRFSSSDGYAAEPDLTSSLQALKHNPHYGKVMIGVITNSDDRVPDILSSFGVHVSTLRHGGYDGTGALVPRTQLCREDFDIDFHCMSYDVGVEKPDRAIFASAESLAAQIISARDDGLVAQAEAKVQHWHKVYVGDEYAKDVEGALQAGWNPIFLETDEVAANIASLTDYPSQPFDPELSRIFHDQKVVKVQSIQGLANWLSGRS